MTSLRDKVAVVTGAGSGIGRETSIALAQKGCHLALVDVNAAGMKETADLIATLGLRVSTHVVDVSNKAAMIALPEEVIKEHGRVNIIINNAGVEITKSFEDQTVDDIEWIVGINFWGVVYGCKFFLPYLRQESEGHIVNVSSMFGFYGIPAQSSYCATKFAVRGLTESLRAELGNSNIGVTCIHPGAINTNIMKNERTIGSKLEESSDKLMKYATQPATVAKKIVRGIEKNKRRVRVGPDAYFTDWLVRLSPILFNMLAGTARKLMGA
ncbi:MAG: SDR family NAD(P)-dependent oxidoreductase [Pseudomonadales bacterium]|nr:SDR family NAD(P)-dependent oxidoreductase [Pseudomonadales bacterium]